ncbi:DNA adenine methylase [Clostridium botulinum]|uniref:DNA adenine methylase n=1 Tax=Clostridium botulinum TaxID=1491 RepID=UPI000772FB48|nr:Dam family site-specific DNA-(adenine-N6)-methyltransferase [Clostridium botulinum]NFF79733.1 Dam family site-specific DNA-(adenine-N6)-methyltransferase [Clostridium botulinum]
MNNTFLKWAGGKNWFVKSESERFPKNYNRYIEPFVGGGAVFFYLQPRYALLGDANKELINTYRAVRDEWESVCTNLKNHAKKHNTDYYYKVRKLKTRKSVTSAARMIYLNRACYNGIYRVNSKGGFNVPIGTAKNITFDIEDFENKAAILRNAELVCQDFQITIEMAEKDDFIFCDPPYAVIDEYKRFVSYTADMFSWNDQIRLLNALVRAKDRGVKIIMTNVDHPAIRTLYKDIDGFMLDTVERYCPISGTKRGRKKYLELIISANII